MKGFQCQCFQESLSGSSTTREGKLLDQFDTVDLQRPQGRQYFLEIVAGATAVGGSTIDVYPENLETDTMTSKGPLL